MVGIYEIKKMDGYCINVNVLNFTIIYYVKHLAKRN